MYTIIMESYELSSLSNKGTLVYLLVCLVGFHVHRTGASCTEEQVQKCRQAAEDESLPTLEGGGTCASQRYVHYTHTCTVSGYRPHIDFCCCAADVKVLCCRYQQSWDRFRCSEAEDTIHTLAREEWSTSSSNEDALSDSSPKSLPMPILLPCILAPVLIVGCCIYCCIRHCRYCHDDGDDDTRWSCRCWSPEKKKNGAGVTLTDPSRPYQFQNSHSGLSGFSENEPLNTILPALLVDAQKRPLEDSNFHSSEGSRLMPSAPPFEDGDDVFTGGPCHHLPQPTTEPHPPGAAGYADQPPGGAGAYGRQASVVSAPPGVFVRQDSAVAGAEGGYFSRQESAPCGPMGPVYEQQPLDNGVNGASIAGVHHQHYGGVHINVNGGARGACPSCSSGVCAPPTYDESLQHQVLHQ